VARTQSQTLTQTLTQPSFQAVNGLSASSIWRAWAREHLSKGESAWEAWACLKRAIKEADDSETMLCSILHEVSESGHQPFDKCFDAYRTLVSENRKIDQNNISGDTAFLGTSSSLNIQVTHFATVETLTES